MTVSADGCRFESSGGKSKDTWFKSSFSNGSGACVQVLIADSVVTVRDSKYRLEPSNDPNDEPIISIDIDTGLTFLDEFTGVTTARNTSVLSLHPGLNGNKILRSADGVALTFTPLELTTFFLGVRAREFDVRLVAA